MVSLAKKFIEAFVAFIFAQVVAVGVAGMTNFSALGIIIAGFFDVIMLALIYLWLTKGI